MKKLTSLCLLPLLAACLLTGFSPAGPVDLSKLLVADEPVELRIDPNATKTTTFDEGMPFLYAYGPEKAGILDTTGGKAAEIRVLPPERGNYKIVRVEALVMSGKVSATVALNDGSTQNNGTPPVLTLRADTSPADCALSDYRVQLQITLGRESNRKIIDRRTVKAVVKGKCGYSQIRDLEDDSVFTIEENSGTVFRFNELLVRPTYVRPNGQVSITFMGDYIEGLVNLQVDSSDIAAVEEKLKNSSVQVANFIGVPIFSRAAQVSIFGPAEAFIYEYNASTESFTRVATTYERDAHVFSATRLGCYVLTPVAL